MLSILLGFVNYQQNLCSNVVKFFRFTTNHLAFLVTRWFLTFNTLIRFETCRNGIQNKPNLTLDAADTADAVELLLNYSATVSLLHLRPREHCLHFNSIYFCGSNHMKLLYKSMNKCVFLICPSFSLSLSLSLSLSRYSFDLCPAGVHFNCILLKKSVCNLCRNYSFMPYMAPKKEY